MFYYLLKYDLHYVFPNDRFVLWKRKSPISPKLRKTIFCGAQERTRGIRVQFGKALIFEVTRRSLKIQMSEIDNFPHI